MRTNTDAWTTRNFTAALEASSINARAVLGEKLYKSRENQLRIILRNHAGRRVERSN